MAINTRYFSTAAAGDGTGSSWANRAALLSAGAYAAAMDSYDFSADGMLALIGPGTYVPTEALATAIFNSGAPALGAPLYMQGCDSSGNILAPPNPDWTSDTPFDDTGFPVFATASNIETITLLNCIFRCIKFTASARNGSVVGNGRYDWCSIINNTSNAAANALGATVQRITNSHAQCAGTAYAQVGFPSGAVYENTRLQGNPSATTGNRNGVETNGNNNRTLIGCTIFGNPGRGIEDTVASTSGNFVVIRSVIANNTSDGARLNNTASQVVQGGFIRNMITGNGGVGINARAALVGLLNNRLRDNAGGNLTNFGNYPLDMNYTTDSDDATEYVDAAAGDFRIKIGATIYGQGYGVSDQIAAAGGGSLVNSGLVG